MFVGKKILLEEIDPDNIEWMRQQRNKPELRQYFREWKDISKDQQSKWYSARGNNSSPEHVYFQIMDITRGTKQKRLIGCCGLHYINSIPLRSAEFGIFISEGDRNRGFGAEALCLLIDFGFGEMNLHKIWAEVYDFNKALGLYKKIGFKESGLLRDNCFKNGKYHNSVVIDMLEDEWENKKSEVK